VDFPARDSGGVYLNEVNTILGFTTIAYASSGRRVDSTSAPRRLIALALEHGQQKLRISM
jgi:D-alanine-D-alanine ligase-like ATP-grasp enzyme